MDYAISVYLDELSDRRAQAEAEQARLKAEQDTALRALDRALSGLSDGNLGSTISEPLAPDFDQLKQNYNTAVSRLNEAFAEIVASIGQSGSDTRELSSATDDMALPDRAAGGRA